MFFGRSAFAFWLIPLPKQRPGPKSGEGADVVEEQDVPDGGAASRHEGLMEFVQRGVGQSHAPRQPRAFSAQPAQVRAREQAVSQRVAEFFDREIQPAEFGHRGRGDGREAEDERHHQQGREPAFQRVHRALLYQARRAAFRLRLPDDMSWIEEIGFFISPRPML